MSDLVAERAVRLYGRDREIGLVQQFLDRLDELDVPRSRRLPGLVFTGTRGSGKTALLTELAQQADQQTPYVMVDFEAIGTESVPELLSALVFGLNRRCGHYGSLPFPRFITGQLVIAQRLTLPADREVARAEVEAALRGYRKVDRLRDFLADLAPQVLRATFPEADHFPGVDAAARYLPDVVIKGLTTWKLGRRSLLGGGQEWYGHQDLGLRRDPLDVLVDLNRQAGQLNDADNRGEVGEMLWAAFLADLRDGFRRGRRAAERSLNCLVLLDNLDTTTDKRFLDGLHRARTQHAAHAPDDPDPLTIVATSRGPLSASDGAPGDAPITAAAASYEHSTRRRDRRWYPVALGDLTQDEVGNMVRASVPQLGLTQRITTAVHWFTEGHPLSTRLVLDVISAKPDKRSDLTVALQVTGADEAFDADGTVEERLVRQFRHGISDTVYHDLVTVSAAADLVRAQRMYEHSDLLTTSRGERAELFGREFWAPDGRLIPVLRRLLSRQLAARGTEHAADWRTVHGWLRADHVEAADENGGYYHALAIGELAPVSRWLTESLRHNDVDGWLDSLVAVTAAPNRLDRRVAPIDQVQQLTAEIDADDVLLARVARLVAARWIAADPLAAGHLHGLYLEVAAEYDELAPSSANGLAVLRNEADRYRALAEKYP